MHLKHSLILVAVFFPWSVVVTLGLLFIRITKKQTPEVPRVKENS